MFTTSWQLLVTICYQLATVNICLRPVSDRWWPAGTAGDLLVPRWSLVEYLLTIVEFTTVGDCLWLVGNCCWLAGTAGDFLVLIGGHWLWVYLLTVVELVTVVEFATPTIVKRSKQLFCWCAEGVCSCWKHKDVNNHILPTGVPLL